MVPTAMMQPCWLANLTAALQIQAALVLFVGVLGWTVTGLVRRRELQRQRSGRLTAAAQQRRDSGAPAPPVCVVLPVRGCRPHSRANWISHMHSEYDGPLRLLAGVEVALGADPKPWGAGAGAGGCSGVCGSSSGVCGGSGGTSGGGGCGGGSGGGDGGANRGGGGGSSGPGYVLFLDDDVALHPGTIGRLVDELEGDPSAFMATGYPFDLVPPAAPLPAYAALAYHLPLSIAFAVSRRAHFVWGGCMMLRAARLDGDPCGVLEAWRDGGYSDDMLLAALCDRLRLPVATHRAALLPQLLGGGGGWRGYWNYLRRQLFVLDTYRGAHNRRLNYTLMAAHSWASFAVAVSLPAALLQLTRATAPSAAAAAAAAHSWLEQHLGVAGAAAAAAAAAAGALGGGGGGGGGGSGGWQAGLRSAAAALGAAACPAPAAGGWRAVALWLFVAAVALAQCSLAWMASQSLALMRALSDGEGGGGGGGKGGGGGGRKDGSSSGAGGGSGGGGSAAILWQAAPISWLRVWLGIWVESAALPACVLWTLCHGEIEWAGITYRKRRGRVETAKPARSTLGPAASGVPGAGGIFKSAAVDVLRAERRLMTTGEITKIALQRGFLKAQGKTPEATMASALYTDVKKKCGQSMFTRPQEGLFGLREWIEEGFFPEGFWAGGGPKLEFGGAGAPVAVSAAHRRRSGGAVVHRVVAAGGGASSGGADEDASDHYVGSGDAGVGTEEAPASVAAPPSGSGSDALGGGDAAAGTALSGGGGGGSPADALALLFGAAPAAGNPALTGAGADAGGGSGGGGAGAAAGGRKRPVLEVGDYDADEWDDEDEEGGDGGDAGGGDGGDGGAGGGGGDAGGGLERLLALSEAATSPLPYAPRTYVAGGGIRGRAQPRKRQHLSVAIPPQHEAPGVGAAVVGAAGGGGAGGGQGEEEDAERMAAALLGCMAGMPSCDAYYRGGGGGGAHEQGDAGAQLPPGTARGAQTPYGGGYAAAAADAAASEAAFAEYQAAQQLQWQQYIGLVSAASQAPGGGMGGALWHGSGLFSPLGPYLDATSLVCTPAAGWDPAAAAAAAAAGAPPGGAPDLLHAMSVSLGLLPPAPLPVVAAGAGGRRSLTQLPGHITLELASPHGPGGAAAYRRGAAGRGPRARAPPPPAAAPSPRTARDLGRLDEWQATIESAEKALGRDHPAVGRAWLDLAKALQAADLHSDRARLATKRAFDVVLAATKSGPAGESFSYLLSRYTAGRGGGTAGAAQEGRPAAAAAAGAPQGVGK
ncbi:MAG: hypothetical protein J3K34DRAFT_522121 [Monoraphidium minutum]|nr:MAG: hypothetical protein J3K34DRAFT_522121 [Monoraphidium minutum]